MIYQATLPFLNEANPQKNVRMLRLPHETHSSSSKSYIRKETPVIFSKKRKEVVSVTQNALLVIADVVQLYRSIPYLDGLEALSIKLDLEENNKISTKDLLETAWFILRNNHSESDSMI